MKTDQSRILARVFAYLRRYPLLAAGTLACALGSSVMVVVFPVVTQRIVDDVLRGGNADALWPMIALAAFGFLAQDGLNTLRILLKEDLPHRAKAVYMYLWDRADKDGKCYPAIGTIDANSA